MDKMRVSLNPDFPVAEEIVIVNAARASFGKRSKMVEKQGAGGHPYKGLSERDTKLIKYLAREKHLLPFRHPTISFLCKAPMFVKNQLVKHQTGMSWSETSRRYVDSSPEVVQFDKLRKHPPDSIKQGSSDETLPVYYSGMGIGSGDRCNCNQEEFDINEMMRLCVTMYDRMIEIGVAPEQARAVLPQGMYVEWTWTGTLLSWLHLIKERTHLSTQLETQQFAKMVAEHIKELFPVSYEAFVGSV